MNRLFFSFLLLAVFASTEIASGQQLLVRKSFNRLTIGDQRFSFRDTNRFIGDLNVVYELQKGVAFEKTAIGLGVSGAAFLGAGLTMYCCGAMSAFFNAFSKYRSLVVARRANNIAMAGLVMFPIGGAMGVASIVLGVVGAVKIKRAIRGYNSGRYSELRLDLCTPTSGGIGMQLTF